MLHKREIDELRDIFLSQVLEECEFHLTGAITTVLQPQLLIIFDGKIMECHKCFHDRSQYDAPFDKIVAISDRAVEEESEGVQHQTKGSPR